VRSGCGELLIILIGKILGSINNIHYFKSISEYEERILHVVVNPNVSPRKVVTVFFDRRVRR